MAKVLDIVEEKINPIIEKLGYEVVEVEYGKKVDGMNMTFYIDKKGGITLDDCEIVHKAIDGPLDEINPTGDEKYILNVSSCGLDRPLKSDKDLARNIGNEVDLKLYKAINKQKEFTGKLEAFDENTVTISGFEPFEKKAIANIVLHLEF
ncbi:MAG: ribosome maturation factor RimP [Firmicutes bacterium]|nr:ribosome maturation factor RimP [Bacillota bacterium]MDY3659006.1 ribosome maturation factor RimP [Eubacteriales bacterium]